MPNDLLATKPSPISFFKRFLFVVKVEGESAFPELIPGRHYLASSFWKPKVGRFVVFPNPLNTQQLLVKKVETITDDKLFVRGTVSWGTSSREIGLISASSVLGGVIFW